MRITTAGGRYVGATLFGQLRSIWSFIEWPNRSVHIRPTRYLLCSTYGQWCQIEHKLMRTAATLVHRLVFLCFLETKKTCRTAALRSSFCPYNVCAVSATPTRPLQYDSSSTDGEPRGRRPASAAIRAMRADIKTYTEVRQDVPASTILATVPNRMQKTGL